MGRKVLIKGKKLKFNSSSNKAQILKILGNSTQLTRSGKNLYKGLSTPLSDTTFWYSVASNRFTPLEDGWGRFNIDNTSGTETIYANIFTAKNEKDFKPNTQYSIFFEFRNLTSSGNSHISISDGAGDMFPGTASIGWIYQGNMQSAIANNTPLKFTATTSDDFSSAYMFMRTFMGVGAKGKITVDVRISVLEGDVSESEFVYESYGEMPSPSYPSKIESISAKNLFDINQVKHGFGEFNLDIEDNVLTMTAYGTVGAQAAILIIQTDDTSPHTLSFKAKKIVGDGKAYSMLQILPYGSDDNSTWKALTTAAKYSPVLNEEYFLKTTVEGYPYYRFLLYNHASTPVTIGEKTQYYDIQFEKGSKPTVFAPIDNIGYKSVGKNLSKETTFRLGNPINADQTQNNFFYIDLAGVELGKQYTLSFKSDRTDDIRFYTYPNEKISGSATGIVTATKNNGIYTATFTITQTHYNNLINSNGLITSYVSTGRFTDVSELMVRLSTSSASYEPYFQASTYIPLIHDLRALPDSKADEIYQSDGKLYDKMNVQLKTLNSQNSWNLSYTESAPYTTLKDVLPPISDNYVANAYSTHYKSHRRTGLAENRFAIGYSGNLIINDKTNGLTIDDWKAYLDAQENAGTPVQVQYELLTAVISELGVPTTLNVLKGENNLECPAETWIIYETEEETDKPEEIRITNDGKLQPFGLTIDYNKTDLPLMAEAIETSQTIAGADGDIVLATTYGARLFDIVAVTDDFLSAEEKEAKREEVRQALNKIKNKNTKLVIEPMGRTYMVKYSGLAEDTNMPKSVEFSIPLKSASAYGISNERYSANGVEYFESNTQKEAGFVMTIEGPVSYPSWSFNGVEMKYNNILISGTRLVINTAKSTVELIGKTGIKTNYLPFYAGEFPKIQNGTNMIFINSGMKIEQIKVEWNDLFL